MLPYNFNEYRAISYGVSVNKKIKMKQILLLFPLVFAACSSSVCSNKEKAEEVMEYVANKYYEYNKSDILGQKRMCVVSKRKNNFHVFQVYTIFMCQEEFGYLRYNMKSLKPYKIKKKKMYISFTMTAKKNKCDLIKFQKNYSKKSQFL